MEFFKTKDSEWKFDAAHLWILEDFLSDAPFASYSVFLWFLAKNTSPFSLIFHFFLRPAVPQRLKTSYLEWLSRGGAIGLSAKKHKFCFWAKKMDKTWQASFNKFCLMLWFSHSLFQDGPSFGGWHNLCYWGFWDKKCFFLFHPPLPS